MGVRIGKVARQVNPPRTGETTRQEAARYGIRRAMASQFDLEEALLGPLAAGRACGDCTVCCAVLEVDAPDFKKPAGVPCTHSARGGCGIHAVRPGICRAWFCGWRRIAGLPEAARPDRSGLLITLDFNRNPRNCLEGVAILIRALDDGRRARRCGGARDRRDAARSDRARLDERRRRQDAGPPAGRCRGLRPFGRYAARAIGLPKSRRGARATTCSASVCDIFSTPETVRDECVTEKWRRRRG